MRAPNNAITVTLALRWSDQDPNMHVNNANIITLVEEARVRASRGVIGTPATRENPRVVRSLEVVYDKEIVYTDTIDAKVWISRIGNTSYQVSHELIQNGHSCVFATTTLVAISSDTRQPIALSDEHRARLQPYFHENS